MRHNYRAWDKGRQRMYSPSEINSLHFVDGQLGIMVVIAEVDGKRADWMVMPDEYILEDLIGSQDVQNKEICEGDILSDGVRTFEVKWSDYYLRYMAWKHSSCLYYLNEPLKNDTRSMRIVGNIHENPELLPE